MYTINSSVVMVSKSKCQCVLQRTDRDMIEQKYHSALKKITLV